MNNFKVIVSMCLISSMTSALDLGQDLVAKAKSKAASEDSYKAQLDSLFNCPYDSIYNLAVKDIKVSDDIALMESARSKGSIAVSLKLSSRWNSSWIEKFRTFLKNNAVCYDSLPRTIGKRASSNGDNCESIIKQKTDDENSESNLRVISFSRNPASWRLFLRGELENEGNCVGIRGLRDECENLNDVSLLTTIRLRHELADHIRTQEPYRGENKLLFAVNVRLKSGNVITLGDSIKPTLYEVPHSSYRNTTLLLNVVKNSDVSPGGIAYGSDAVTTYSSLYMDDDSVVSDLDITIPDSIAENMVSIFVTAVGPTHRSYEPSIQEKNFIEEYLQRIRPKKPARTSQPRSNHNTGVSSDPKKLAKFSDSFREYFDPSTAAAFSVGAYELTEPTKMQIVPLLKKIKREAAEEPGEQLVFSQNQFMYDLNGDGRLEVLADAEIIAKGFGGALMRHLIVLTWDGTKWIHSGQIPFGGRGANCTLVTSVKSSISTSCKDDGMEDGDEVFVRIYTLSGTALVETEK